MIRYALRCDKGHDFDGWFRSAAGFDTLNAEGQVSCSICGSVSVQKAPMAPAVPVRDEPKARPLEGPGSKLEAAVATLRKHVEETSDYVGDSFATTARKMHQGELPQRAIYGEAKLEEAKKLVEDGVPVAPLPFRVTRKLS